MTKKPEPSQGLINRKVCKCSKCNRALETEIYGIGAISIGELVEDENLPIDPACFKFVARAGSLFVCRECLVDILNYAFKDTMYNPNGIGLIFPIDSRTNMATEES